MVGTQEHLPTAVSMVFLLFCAILVAFLYHMTSSAEAYFAERANDFAIVSNE